MKTYMGLAVIGLLTIHAGAATPTREMLIEAAWEANPSLQAAAFRLEAAQGAQRQARSAYYPRLYAAAGYTITDNPPQAFMMALNQRRLDMRDPAFDPNRADSTDNIRFSLGTRYRLYDGARGARATAAGLAGRVAAEHLRAARNELAHAVTRGYYQVREAQAFATVQAAALESLEESLRAARERFASGSAVKTDVLNLEVQVAQASENLIRARNGVQLSIAALNTTIGRPLVPDTGIPETEPVSIESSTPAIDGIERRPEYAAATLQAMATASHLSAVRGERGPVLNAFGSVDWDSEDFDQQNRSYTAGLMLEWTFFSGFQASGKVAEASANRAAAEAGREHVRQLLELDLKQARLTLDEARARLEVTARAVQSAEEALRITRAQYREGAADIATLLMAELGLTESRMRETAARYDCCIAHSNLARAGGLLTKGDE